MNKTLLFYDANGFVFAELSCPDEAVGHQSHPYAAGQVVRPDSVSGHYSEYAVVDGVVIPKS